MKRGVKKYVNRLSAIFGTKAPCTRCKGSGKIQRLFCGGSGQGMGSCASCDGRGEVDRLPIQRKPGTMPLMTFSAHDPGPSKSCATCYRHGRSRCTSCQGNGVIDRILCKGTGKRSEIREPGQEPSRGGWDKQSGAQQVESQIGRR